MTRNHSTFTLGLVALGLLSCLSASGCKSPVAAQPLPSAHSGDYDPELQYFPAGPENKLLRQIEALDAQKASGIDVDDPLGGP